MRTLFAYIGTYIGNVIRLFFYMLLALIGAEAILTVIWAAMGGLAYSKKYWMVHSGPTTISIAIISHLSNLFDQLMGFLLGSTLPFLHQWLDDWQDVYYRFQTEIRPPNAFDGQTVVKYHVVAPIGWQPHIGLPYYQVLWWPVIAIFAVVFVGLALGWLPFRTLGSFPVVRSRRTVVEDDDEAEAVVTRGGRTVVTVEGAHAVRYRLISVTGLVIVLVFILIMVMSVLPQWVPSEQTRFDRKRAQATAEATQQTAQKIDTITQTDLDSYVSSKFPTQTQSLIAANLIQNSPASLPAVLHARDKLETACGLYAQAKENHRSPDGYNPDDSRSPVLTAAQAKELRDTAGILKRTVPGLNCSSAAPARIPVLQTWSKAWLYTLALVLIVTALVMWRWGKALYDGLTPGTTEHTEFPKKWATATLLTVFAVFLVFVGFQLMVSHLIIS